MGKAIGYAMNQWAALKWYTGDPQLSVDNNVAERMLRMVVIGRKNYLFAGSEAEPNERQSFSLRPAANGTATTLAYFNDVLKKVTTWPASKIDDLLPPTDTRPNQPPLS